MKFDDIKQHYGSVEKARRALGFKTAAAIYRWKYCGYVPEPQQFRIEVLTEGKLKAERQEERQSA